MGAWPLGMELRGRRAGTGGRGRAEGTTSLAYIGRSIFGAGLERIAFPLERLVELIWVRLF